MNGRIRLFKEVAVSFKPGSKRKWKYKRSFELSVVVLCYNGEKYIEKRLNSIINQVYLPDEIIILDDASTDNSVQLAKSILKNCNIRNRIICNSENNGCGKQIIKGISLARGEFIWFAEQDDYCNEFFLESFKDKLSDDSVNVLFCKSLPVNEIDQVIDGYYSMDERIEANYCIEGLEEIGERLCMRNTVYNLSAAIIRRSALAGVEEFIPRFKVFYDWLLYAFALKKGKIYYCHDVLNYHMRHEKSLIAAYRKHIHFYEDLINIKEYILDNYSIKIENLDKMLYEIEREFLQCGCNGFSSLDIKQHPSLGTSYKELKQKIEKLKRGDIMKTYLVTGGAGFIGSNFISYMFEKYDDNIRIINLDSLTYAGNLENLTDVEKRPEYYFEKADICDRVAVSEIFKKYDIDYVINFAAESHVDRSIIDPEIFAKTNIIGTQILLNAAKEKWFINNEWLPEKRFIQVSTDEVYGSLGKKGFFTENTPLDPHSPYSASKAAADLLLKAYVDTYGMPVNITRCSNNYGPYQFPEKLLPLVINNAIEGKKIPIYGTGKNVRDWIYVKEHCRAIDLIVNQGKPGEIYNIGGHNERTNLEIVKTVLAVLKDILGDNEQYKHINEELIHFVPDRKGHDFRYAIDPYKIVSELGWCQEVCFDEGIRLTVKWYLDNKEWLNKAVSGEYRDYYDKVYKGL